MTRESDVKKYLESESRSQLNIEPGYRSELVYNHLKKTIDIYDPEVVVKAGLGNGRLLLQLLKDVKNIVVVEPLLENIECFLEDNKDNPDVKKLYIINGDFANFPIDYLKVDMLVCVDYLDFQNSSQVLDEFKRAIKFESILFLGSVVLDDEDFDGVYDDFFREINPIHNDFYLPGDLQTMMKLKGFKSQQGGVEKFNISLEERIKYYSDIYDNDKITEKGMKFLESNQDSLKKLYSYDSEQKTIDERYITAVFKKNKYEE